MHQFKSATCCYCGSRTTLQLRGNTRHELTCGNCGAPLSRLKMLPSEGKTGAGNHSAHLHPAPSRMTRKVQERTQQRPKKRKKTKSFKRRAFEEIWDVIEDIFD